MDAWEAQLREHLPALERFVKFRVSNLHDAEDIVQETCAAAAQNRQTLRSPDAFKGWLLAIARNKCRDYYRKKAADPEISFSSLPCPPRGRGVSSREDSPVLSTLRKLRAQDRQMLFLFYFQEWPQARIADRLGIPLGTVKSRLHYARESFRKMYPYPPSAKGAKNMTKMPDSLPPYAISPSPLPPFSVRWEEMMGWFIVPRLGEKLTWAMYDFPEKKRAEQCAMEVVGRAQVHGIEGVEICALETDPMECNSAGGQAEVSRRFVAQLTDTHCRILAESHMENGVNHFYTFLDGGDFLNSWGFGENNCGNEVNLAPKGDITRTGSQVEAKNKPFLLDIVGRYSVTIGGKTYDTVCVMDVETYDEGMATEQYLDSNGRTVLWRRFNRADWRQDRYQKPWTEMLPDNERITVNGQTYVHWYDCITDYIL